MPEADKTMNAAPAADQIDKPTVLKLDNWIPYQFSYVSNQVSLFLEDLYKSRFGLTVPGWRVMAVLAMHEPLSAKEVAAHTAMDQVQVTRAINHLSSIGMISRRVDAGDRRKVVLRLSQRGGEVYATIAPYARNIEMELLSDLTPDEIATLRALTDKVVAVAKVIFDDKRQDVS